MKNTTTTTTTSTLSHYILHTCTTNTIAPKAHNMAPITSAISGTCTSTCTRGGTQFSCILSFYWIIFRYFWSFSTEYHKSRERKEWISTISTKSPAKLNKNTLLQRTDGIII